MRAGRSIQSRISAESADMQVAGYVGTGEVLESLVDQFVLACRTGIPARHLPGQALFRSTHVHATIDVREQQVRQLKEAISDAETTALNASRRALKETDDEQADWYNEEAKKARQQARNARHTLAELTAQPQAVAPDRVFDVFTDVWVPAFARLKTCGGRVSQAEANALDVLLPTFRMFLRSGVWWATATLRINTTDGVAELGPIEWQVTTAGRGNQVVNMNLAEVPTIHERTRADLRAQLLASGRITQDAANTAVNAPFRQLVYVLLHALQGEPWPDFVSDQWRDPLFVDWVTGVYTDPDWWWLGSGKYLVFNALRQYVTGFTADHGSCSPTDFADITRTPGEMTRLAQEVDVRRARSGSRTVRPWAPSVLPLPGSPAGKHCYGPVVCACGEPARIVARVPEAPRDLLCRCGRMPDPDRYGMDPRVRFPDEYRALEVSQDACGNELTLRIAKARTKLGATGTQLMAQTGLLARGTAQAELARAAGSSNISVPLHRLARFGYVRQEGTGRGALWRYTDEGAAYAGVDLAEHQPNDR